MIIIKTANGDRFVNDKAVTMVEHDREKAVVNVYGDKGVFFHIEDVEGIIYNNDAQPIHWKDEGSEIQRLKKANEELSEWGGRMRDGYMKMEQERDELKERLAKLEPQPKDYENDLLRDTVFNEMERIATEERELQRRIHPNWGMKSGNGVRFLNIAHANEIETVGQLLSVGRARFEKFKYMGSKCADDVSKALENLYGIKQW